MESFSVNQQTSVDRINKIRKKVREFRAFKEEEFFAFDKLKGIGTQSDGVSAGMSGSQRINMKRYCNEPIVLLPVKSKRPKEEMATHLHLPEWPCALRGSLATYSVGLDFLSANGTLMMLIKRPDPSGITLSSSQGMCCAISVCEPGLPISYVTDDLRLTEQIDDSAEWLILYCDPQLVAGDRDVAPDEDSNAFIVLASSFSAALRQDAMEAATVRGGSKAKHMHRANETLAEVVRALMNGNYNSMKVALQDSVFLTATLEASDSSGAGTVSLLKTMDAFGQDNINQTTRWTMLLGKEDPKLWEKDRDLSDIFTKLHS